MEFVEQYLALPSVWSFEDKEQNLLTYEVHKCMYSKKNRKTGYFGWHSNPRPSAFQATLLPTKQHACIHVCCIGVPHVWRFHTLQVVCMARMMVYFGFYNFSKLLQLTRVLLSGLDNKMSVVSPLSPNPGARNTILGVAGTCRPCGLNTVKPWLFEHIWAQ